MAINNPEAILFCNEVVRPLCERIKALKADIDAARMAYDGGIGDYFFNFGGEDVDDGREAEGISRLVGNDVLAFVDRVLYQIKAEIEENSGEVVIGKPCVRTLIT